jgi:hypothetical protein
VADHRDEFVLAHNGDPSGTGTRSWKQFLGLVTVAGWPAWSPPRRIVLAAADRDKPAVPPLSDARVTVEIAVACADRAVAAGSAQVCHDS